MGWPQVKDFAAVNDAAEWLGSYNYTIERLRPIEYVIDGFLANKITVIAGAAGVGKTSLLVPLACIAAGLASNDTDPKATLRRRVAYVTEDAEQVERILYGMRKKGFLTASEEEFRYWFDIIPAKRAQPEQLAQFITNIRQEKTIKAGAEFSHYETEPLIVLDTASATIHLDNENDNSQAGNAIAIAKQSLGNAALWIVGHTSKVSSRDDIKNMSARGAGAFEGDANAVAYVIDVEKVRFMVLGKRRFVCEYEELKFSAQSDFEMVSTPWGVPQRVWYQFGLPSVAEEGERDSLKNKAQEALSLEVRESLRGKILAALMDANKDSRGLNTSQLVRIVGGKKTILVETLEAMKSNGVIRAEIGLKNAVTYFLA